MIKGIQILKTVTESHWTAGGFELSIGIFCLFMTILCLVSLGICIYQLIKDKRVEDKGAFVGSILMACIVGVVAVGFLNSYFTRTQYTTTKYQAIINNEVKYNEFIEKYNILEQDGSVYIIENKLEDKINN